MKMQSTKNKQLVAMCTKQEGEMRMLQLTCWLDGWLRALCRVEF